MPKLKAAAPRLGTLAPRIGYAPNDEQSRSRHRDSTQAWRAWYKTSRWQKLRWSILVRDLFTCALCKQVEGNTSRLVCDHIEQHHGNEAAFWAGPFQTLCKQCHDSVKQAEERRLA